MNALTEATLLASTSISTPSGDDAELIRMCDAHAAKIATANAADAVDGSAADLAYSASVDFINATRATTLAGLLAKARAAKAEAKSFHSDSDKEHWQNCPAENWAPDVCNELLELFGAARRASPDAELIAVCAEFDDLEQQTGIIHGTGPRCVKDDDEANKVSAPLFARMHILLDRMDELRATTPAGIQARAHSLALHGGHGQYSFDCDTSIVGRLLHYLMRDSAALGGSMGVVQVPPSPDADLLKACAEFDELERAYIAAGGNHAPGSPEEDAAEAERARLSDAQEPLVDRMWELRAFTREGQVTRARSLALWDAELMKPDRGDTGAWLTQAIVRDLLAGSAEA